MVHYLHYAIAGLRKHGYEKFVMLGLDWLRSQERSPQRIVARGIGRMDEHTLIGRPFYNDDSITELAALHLWDAEIAKVSKRTAVDALLTHL